MADKKKMSMEDILAACRGSDGAPSSDEPAKSEEKVAPESSAEPAPAKDPKAMSAAEILAAARTGGAEPAAEKTAAAEEPADAGPKKKPSEMSVAEMLAAARGGGGGAEKPKPKAAAKPVAKKASKASPKEPAKPARTGPMDTSSILAAARSGDKPGPISKSELAAKGKGDPKAKTKPVLPPMPEKPAYAKPKAKASASSDRRGFIAVVLGSFLAVGFTTLSLTNLLWVLGLARFMFPNILIEPPSKFKVGFPGDFASGTVDTKFKAQFGVWVTNIEYGGQQQIVALKTVCTHLGCTPNWLEAEQKFKCPCHGSGFYKDGVNFEGPAPRPLERYAIRIADDGQLEIDKSKTFQEEMGQWNDPSCFVGV